MSTSALVVEGWVWYSITLVVVAARMISRRMLYGSFKKLKVDDYLMLLAVVTDTALLVGVKILTYTPTNLINPDDNIVLTDEDIQLREFGSKMVIVVEQMQIMTIWLVKACLLIMYSRLTTSLNQNLIVKIVAGYVAFGFVLMEILFFGVWCRPFWHYWQVPTESIQCSAEHNHLITNAVLNITSDMMIICIPMPVFLMARLTIKRKAILCSVFALGTFTILCAILNKYYSFSEVYGTEWIYWYIRESSTALITANLPLTWTLLQRIFSLGSFHNRSTGPRTGEPTTRFRSAYGNLASRTREERSRTGPATKNDSMDDLDVSPSESQEQFNRYGIPLKIYQHNEVHITTEEADPERDPQTPPNVQPLGLSSPAKKNSSESTSEDRSSTREHDMGITTVCRGS